MLHYACDVRVIVWEMMYFIVTGWTYSLWGDLTWLQALPLVFTCAMLSFFGATITHNCIHVPMFTKEWMNSLWQVVLSLTYGWPVSALIPGHNLSHHKFTNTQKDAMRPQKMQYQTNLWNYLIFPIATVRAIAKYDAEYMDDQRKRGRPIWNQYLLEALCFYPLQVLLLYLSPSKYFWTVFLPQLYAKWQIIAMNILQHDGCPTPEEHKYNHSRNFTGWWINFLTFNNGYHAIHHMHPGWHWSRLKEAHERLVAPHNAPHLNQTSIFRYCWRSFISPGQRVAFDGSSYQPPKEFLPDLPWYSGTSETYSVGSQ